MRRVLALIVIAAGGALLGALLGPPGLTADGTDLALCIEAMPVQDLLSYALATPADCVGSLFGRTIGLGRALIGAVAGALMAAAGGWAVSWRLRHHAPSAVPADVQHLILQCARLERVASELETERLRGWAILPSQSAAYQQAVEQVQMSLASARRRHPERVQAILNQLLWRRPELTPLLAGDGGGIAGGPQGMMNAVTGITLVSLVALGVVWTLAAFVRGMGAG
jgi:hypothetical protein